VVGVGVAAAVGVHFWWSSSHKAAQPAAVAISDKSIAVLPFTDMSEKRDQEYFADGMAEEILDLLAKLPGMRVIGRTSSFQFKGKNEDLRVIGGALGAAYVVEGSVRKSGERLRVTAAVIGPPDRHHWPNTRFGSTPNPIASRPEAGDVNKYRAKASSIGRRPFRALALRGLNPPSEIVGEPGERPRERRTCFADRLARLVQRLSDRSDGQRT
jgi:TolB-like protein